MDIRSLKYFIEVVRQNNFTKAAKQLYITQPMLSKAIKQLEDELGIVLIERKHAKLKLTDAGKALYQSATDICLRFDSLYDTVNDIKNLDSGTVTLSIPSVLLNAFFPDILYSFRKKYPNLQIHINELGSKDVAKRVLDGDESVGFVMLPVKDSLSFDIHTVCVDCCVLVCHKNHPLAGQKRVHLSELKEENLILFNNNFTIYDSIMKECAQLQMSPKILYTSSLETFLINMVLLQEGVTIMPRPIVHNHLNKDLVTIPLDPVISWSPAFITPHNRYIPYASRTFLEYSMDYFQKNSKRFFSQT